jgi:hypothetical protein
LPNTNWTIPDRDGSLRDVAVRCARGWLLFLALSCCWLGSVSLARAQEPEPLRVLILEGPTQDWVRRVRGQLSDLPVAISTLALVVEGLPQAELARQLGPLAEHRDAALVAWLANDGVEPGGSGARRTDVAIWFARSGRFFARRLGARWRELSASDRSAALELAALSVRSAVRSLLLDPSKSQPAPTSSEYGVGGPVNPTPPNRASGTTAPSTASGTTAPNDTSGTTAPSTVAPTDAERASAAAESGLAAPQPAAAPSAPEPPAATEVGPIVVSPGSALVATDLPSADRSAPGDGADAPAFRLDLDWNAELGVVGQLPGPPAYAAAGMQLGVRARSGAWAVLALAQLGLPLRSQLGPSQVELQQHALQAELQYLTWERGAWSLGPLARAGVRFARRETVDPDPALRVSQAKWQEGLRLGLGAVTEFRWGTHFGASLRGVLHWDPRRPKYVLRDDANAPVASAELWAVQPSLELCGNWYW